MLIEFKITNFLSIKDEVVLSFEASSSKELAKNIIQNRHNRLLKIAGIYGPNASGKSNIIKAVLFFRNLVKQSHSFNVDTVIPSNQFKLDRESMREPSGFEITFIKNNAAYRYGFSCLGSRIVDEYLFKWDNSKSKPRRSILFQRKDTNDYTFKVDVQKQRLIESQMGENVLYLSRATALNFEKLRDPYDFIVNDLIINSDFFWSNYTKMNLSRDPELKNKVLDMLQKADFGGITDVTIEKKKGKSVSIHANFSPGGINFDPIKENETDILLAKFLHKLDSGRTVEFNEWEESHGTMVAFSLLGPIFNILETGKVLFIDELETGLHPSICEFLIRLFQSKLNKDGAQLLFTTHNTNLLSINALRRDQIYITSREPNKGTELDSLLEFKLREGMDFEKVYLAGRVGGLPFIDETILD